MFQPTVEGNPNLLSELRTLIGSLGESGGLVSPSVYDTALLLRLYPPQAGVVPGLQWLLRQQHADGGWGEPTVPAARDVPSLAAVLTLHVYRHLLPVESAIASGLAFLRRQAPQWQTVHIDLVPIAAEMILPYLLQEAEKAGLMIDHRPYAHVFELRRRKLARLANVPLAKHDTPIFSWEALGYPFTPDVLDPWTGVGHSPAATAAWLAAAAGQEVDPILRAQAEAYLARAEATTGLGIRGVVPFAYPITGFELCYALYPLLLTGLLNHPALADVVKPQVRRLRTFVDQNQGLGFGEGFTPDVDCTSVAVSVLLAAGETVDIGLVKRFWHHDHFYTFAWELNPSVLSNIHALYALTVNGERCRATEGFLINRQEENGAWKVDKWHTSWRYSTLEALAAFQHLGYPAELARAACALVDDQNADGSWGAAHGARSLETVYGVMGLNVLPRSLQSPQVKAALRRGQAWLQTHAHHSFKHEQIWLGKETYSPVRVDAAYRLCALAMAQEQPAARNRIAVAT
jgi:hypothetical protein